MKVNRDLVMKMLLELETETSAYKEKVGKAVNDDGSLSKEAETIILKNVILDMYLSGNFKIIEESVMNSLLNENEPLKRIYNEICMNPEAYNSLYAAMISTIEAHGGKYCPNHLRVM